MEGGYLITPAELIKNKEWKNERRSSHNLCFMWIFPTALSSSCVSNSFWCSALTNRSTVFMTTFTIYIQMKQKQLRNKMHVLVSNIPCTQCMRCTIFYFYRPHTMFVLMMAYGIWFLIGTSDSYELTISVKTIIRCTRIDNEYFI